jgi:hypothetical protein
VEIDDQSLGRAAMPAKADWRATKVAISVFDLDFEDDH